MLTPGSRIGGFLIGDLLGKGAMGEVYKGEQLSLKRPVAVKRIATHLLENEDMVRRFKREAQVLAKVGHPNVVGVIECEEFADPSGSKHLLLIMELIEGGRSLKAHLGKPIDWRLATCVVRMCADGLAAAYEQHVVHRDIKPDNIMMTRKGIAKLVDFGLAKAAESTALTMQAAPMGTPLFMSPEACRGEEIGHAGDLYSLGVSWWFMLTGQYPFQAANLHGLLYKHISEPLPPATGLFDHVPEPIVKLVYQCLAKEAADRPASAQKLVEAIESLPAQGLLIPRDARELVGSGAASTSTGGATTAATLVAGQVDRSAATIANSSGQDATAATAIANAGRTVAADLSPQGAVAATVVANLAPSTAATANTIISPTTAAAQAATVVQSAPAPVPAPSGKGGLLAVVIVAVLVLGGVGAWLALRGGQAIPEPSTPSAAATAPTAEAPKPVLAAPAVTPTAAVPTDTLPAATATAATQPPPADAPPAEAQPTGAVVVAPLPVAPADTPKTPDAPQTTETAPVAETPKPTEQPKPVEQPKPTEQPTPVAEAPKPTEQPKPVEQPKPIDTSAFDRALAAKDWKGAKSAAEALPEPARADAQAQLARTAGQHLRSVMRAVKPLYDDKQYAEAARRLTAEMDAFQVADSQSAEIYRTLAKSIRQAAQEAQEQP